MIKYLRAQLERCLMDRAFKTLHDKIADQDKQIRNLIAAREKVAKHIHHETNESTQRVKHAVADKKVKESELDRQLGINRILKKKRHLEGQRQKAIIQQLRDFTDNDTFLKICEDIGRRPDSEFLGDFRE
jgi:hypothetical protein